jgi:hypothetical protein
MVGGEFAIQLICRVPAEQRRSVLPKCYLLIDSSFILESKPHVV